MVCLKPPAEPEAFVCFRRALQTAYPSELSAAASVGSSGGRGVGGGAAGLRSLGFCHLRIKEQIAGAGQLQAAGDHIVICPHLLTDSDQI